MYYLKRKQRQTGLYLKDLNSTHGNQDNTSLKHEKGIVWYALSFLMNIHQTHIWNMYSTLWRYSYPHCSSILLSLPWQVLNDIQQLHIKLLNDFISEFIYNLVFKFDTDENFSVTTDTKKLWQINKYGPSLNTRLNESMSEPYFIVRCMNWTFTLSILNRFTKNIHNWINTSNCIKAPPPPFKKRQLFSVF